MTGKYPIHTGMQHGVSVILAISHQLSHNLSRFYAPNILKIDNRRKFARAQMRTISGSEINLLYNTIKFTRLKSKCISVFKKNITSCLLKSR